MPKCYRSGAGRATLRPPQGGQFHRRLEAEKLSGISRSTLYEKIKFGDIETVKIGCSIMSLKRFFGSAGVDFKLLYESEFYRHATHRVGGSEIGRGSCRERVCQYV